MKIEDILEVYEKFKKDEDVTLNIPEAFFCLAKEIMELKKILNGADKE